MAAPWTAGARVRILGKLHGQDTVNVLHFATNSQINDPGAADALVLQLIAAVVACAIQTLLPATTSDWTFVGCDGARIAPVVQDPLFQAAPANSVGTLSPTSVSFAASLVQVRTSGGGRSGRGRVFLPPPGETELAASAMDGPTLALLQAFVACLAGKFIGQAATEQWRIGVLSRKTLANNPANFDNAFREATSLVPVQDMAVMRSRRKGHGN